MKGCHDCQYSSPRGGHCFKENFYGRRPLEIKKIVKGLIGECDDFMEIINPEN